MYGTNPLLSWLLSPLQRWHLASPVHKFLAVAAGAGVAYYTHTRMGWKPWQVSAAGVGTAYGTSLVLHTAKQSAQAAPPALQNAQAPVMDGRPRMAQEPQQMQGGAAPQMPPRSNVVDINERIRQANEAYARAQAAQKVAPAAPPVVEPPGEAAAPASGESDQAASAQ